MLKKQSKKELADTGLNFLKIERADVETVPAKESVKNQDEFVWNAQKKAKVMKGLTFVQIVFKNTVKEIYEPFQKIRTF